MRLIAFTLPAFLVPLAVCLIPVLLFRIRHHLISPRLFLLLPIPYVAWLVTGMVADRHGSLSNAFLEPALVGLFTGLTLVPQILFAGPDRRDAARRFITAACTSTLFAIVIATSIPPLAE
jgi:hypothetical protein